MRYVKGFCAMLFAAGLMFSAGSLFAEVDDGSHVTITSPKDGATVGETFELTYELTKGSKAATWAVTWGGGNVGEGTIIVVGAGWICRLGSMVGCSCTGAAVACTATTAARAYGVRFVGLG